jgi:hypothetical protein
MAQARDPTPIIDERSASELRDPTFSGHRRLAVIEQLVACLDEGDIEGGCHWAAEMIVSGLYQELWDTVISYTCKQVHTTSPRLPVYLSMKFNMFR